MPKKGLRPHTWKYKDPREREQNLSYMRMKAQAHFRKEEFSLSFEEFQSLWQEHWDERGRGSKEYCLTRNDSTLPWDADNTICVQRIEYLRRNISNGNIYIHRHKANETS